MGATSNEMQSLQSFNGVISNEIQFLQSLMERRLRKYNSYIF
jgi:hypothetical protein